MTPEETERAKEALRDVLEDLKKEKAVRRFVSEELKKEDDKGQSPEGIGELLALIKEGTASIREELIEWKQEIKKRAKERDELEKAENVAQCSTSEDLKKEDEKRAKKYKKRMAKLDREIDDLDDEIEALDDKAKMREWYEEMDAKDRGGPYRKLTWQELRYEPLPKYYR